LCTKVTGLDYMGSWLGERKGMKKKGQMYQLTQRLCTEREGWITITNSGGGGIPERSESEQNSKGRVQKRKLVTRREGLL